MDKKKQRMLLKSIQNNEQVDRASWTPFRACEKRYKRQFPPPDLSDVLDLRSSPFPVQCRQINSSAAYILSNIPGLVILPSFLSSETQKQLCKWSLVDQARAPNPTNLDVHYILPEEGLWNAHLHSPELVIQPRCPADSDSIATEKPGPRKLVNNMPATLDNFQTFYDTSKPEPAPSSTAAATPAHRLIPKLRWANIGWLYHWGTKQYDFTKGKGYINPHLRDICQSAVAAVDWEQVFDSDESDWGESGPDWKTWSETYEPDAGIVNFYQTKDTLMGHVDRSEVCATSPLVSISLGNSAIFLIGGLTRDIEPTPILLRSGDVAIMSGPACRRAYHGVPRILENTLPAHLSTNEGDDEWNKYAAFLQTTRININVRQVFPKGFDPASVHR
ncbi:hypothetical protein C8J56DRAFT_1005720 [Mycena floridula]|nr:hypothetical protein C8J56DRAFT_1005720 [Mycena floridula]